MAVYEGLVGNAPEPETFVKIAVIRLKTKFMVNLPRR